MCRVTTRTTRTELLNEINHPDIKWYKVVTCIGNISVDKHTLLEMILQLSTTQVEKLVYYVAEDDETLIISD